jgi:hypothetical protein
VSQAPLYSACAWRSRARPVERIVVYRALPPHLRKVNHRERSFTASAASSVRRTAAHESGDHALPPHGMLIDRACRHPRRRTPRRGGSHAGAGRRPPPGPLRGQLEPRRRRRRRARSQRVAEPRPHRSRAASRSALCRASPRRAAGRTGADRRKRPTKYSHAGRSRSWLERADFARVPVVSARCEDRPRPLLLVAGFTPPPATVMRRPSPLDAGALVRATMRATSPRKLPQHAGAAHREREPPRPSRSPAPSRRRRAGAAGVTQGMSTSSKRRAVRVAAARSLSAR